MGWTQDFKASGGRGRSVAATDVALLCAAVITCKESLTVGNHPVGFHLFTPSNNSFPSSERWTARKVRVLGLFSLLNPATERR